MKKLTITVIIAMILAAILVALAFFFIDLGGHETFSYDLFAGKKPVGSADVDRYVTEDKVIYKQRNDYPGSLGYPAGQSKLTLKRRTMLPLKYSEETKGVKGVAQTILIDQKVDKTDFLFLRPPQYFFLKDFETGHKTMVFSPENVMLYMPIMEKYNFWRKGAQFFEVMVPVEEPVPLLRDKIEIRYLNEEYITIMGRKVEAECFSVSSKGLPEAKIFLSKYTHKVLSLEVPSKKMRFVLTGSVRKYREEFERFFNNLKALLGSARSGRGQPAEIINEEGSFPESAGAGSGQSEASRPEKSKAPLNDTVAKKKREIFFESEKQILSGYLWMPEGEKPFPAVILVGSDGPVSNAEQALLEIYAERLLASGFAVLAFDNPGQGKSQGNFIDLDDGKKISNIRSAFSYLKDLQEIKKDKIILIGYKAGGYLALKAAEKTPDTYACVVLGMPFISVETDALNKSAREKMQTALNKYGYKAIDEGYMNAITERLTEHLEGVIRSSEDFSFFTGIKVPLKGYRDYLARTPYQAVLSFEEPLLVIEGQKDVDFNAQITDRLKKALSENKRANIKTAVLLNLDGYMGKGGDSGALANFEVNEDALKSIKSWIDELKQLEQFKKQLEPSEAQPEPPKGQPEMVEGQAGVPEEKRVIEAPQVPGGGTPQEGQ